MKRVFAALIIATLSSGISFADINITQTATENGFTDHVITFEEPGVPTDVNMDPFTFYEASDGITLHRAAGF